MSFGTALRSSVRALVIAAATGAAALGLVVVFHPFAAPATAVVDSSTADGLRARIDLAREELRQTEAALDNVNTTPSVGMPLAEDARAQYEAQIAAATERRDLALRHAQAIRDGLGAGGAVASLAEIRDSVVIGQLLGQQAALDATIAEKGASLKPSHPVMRALLAQKSALVTQINAEAGRIAAALEAEAKLDDAQIKLLQGQLANEPQGVDLPAAPDSAALQARAAAQRAELDSLMDAYFSLKPSVASGTAQPLDLLSPLNLIVVAAAALAAIVFQVALSQRRRRERRAADLARWRDDHDPEIAGDGAAPAAEEVPALRRAS